MERNTVEKEQLSEAERRDQKIRFIMTLVTSILLCLLFAFDLALFILGLLEWYVFASLLVMYLVVFPFAVVMMSKLRRVPKFTVSEQEKIEQMIKEKTAEDLKAYEE